MKTESVSYAGKRVYIGIDVHRAFFVASCMSEGVVVKRCRMEPKSSAIVSLVTKYFPGADVRTCYEAGYSGFWLHRKLEVAGISNIVVNAASIEVAANDRVKTDKRDSLKMAEQLASGRLRGIRVPSLAEEHRRLLTANSRTIDASQATYPGSNTYATAPIWVIPIADSEGNSAFGC